MIDNNKVKLLILWETLCKNTDENHAMNADEIREELAKRGISVIRRVVADDIAALNKYGYEVLSYKKKYYYYYVVNRPLDTAEVVLLADALKSSRLSARQKNALIEKLSGLLCSYQAESVSKHLVSVADEKKSGASIIYNVDAIERAIDENKQISFLYFDYDRTHNKVYRKNGEKYVVNPVVMVWDRNNYYLLCFSDNHENIATYRIDKMDKVWVSEIDRTPHREYELFDTEEYCKQAFSMFGGEKQKVTLLFDPEILSEIFNRFGDGVRVVEQSEKVQQGRRKSTMSDKDVVEKASTAKNGEKFKALYSGVDLQNNHAVHPTQKPVALLEYLIKTYTKENEVVISDF